MLPNWRSSSSIFPPVVGEGKFPGRRNSMEKAYKLEQAWHIKKSEKGA